MVTLLAERFFLASPSEGFSRGRKQAGNAKYQTLERHCTCYIKDLPERNALLAGYWMVKSIREFILKL